MLTTLSTSDFTLEISSLNDKMSRLFYALIKGERVLRKNNKLPLTRLKLRTCILLFTKRICSFVAILLMNTNKEEKSFVSKKIVVVKRHFSFLFPAGVNFPFAFLLTVLSAIMRSGFSVDSSLGKLFATSLNMNAMDFYNMIKRKVPQ